MLHPSYTDLIEVVNSDVEPGEQPVVQSRYSIVMATSRRARQIVAGEEPLVDGNGKKPLSVAVDELYKSKIRILSEEEAEEEMAKEEAAKEEDSSDRNDTEEQADTEEQTDTEEENDAEEQTSVYEQVEDEKEAE